MTLFDSDHRIPKDPGAADSAHRIIRTALSAIPILGSSSAEIFNHLIIPPLLARRDEFIDDLAERLRAVEDRRPLTAEQFAKDSVFLDAVATAATIAVRTSQPAKREALLNAITNSAMSTELSSVQQQVFFALIDRYTELHLQLLDMFDDPDKWHSKDGRHLDKSKARAFVWSVFPDLGSELASSVWAELKRDGLVTTPEIDNGPEGGVVRRTTPYGRAFLMYVKNPLVTP